MISSKLTDKSGDNILNLIFKGFNYTDSPAYFPIYIFNYFAQKDFDVYRNLTMLSMFNELEIINQGKDNIFDFLINKVSDKFEQMKMKNSNVSLSYATPLGHKKR